MNRGRYRGRGGRRRGGGFRGNRRGGFRGGAGYRGRGRGRGRGGRGRGRGGRGRGRGYGRARGYGRGRRGGNVFSNDMEYSNIKNNNNNKNINVDEHKNVDDKDWSTATIEDIQNLFLNDNSILKHINAIKNCYGLYIRNLKLFIKYKIILTLSTSTKAKIIAGLLINNQNNDVKWLLKYNYIFSVGEIARCIAILDAPRAARQMEKKLNKLIKLKESDNKAVRDITISKLRTKIHNFKVDNHNGSLNGCKLKIFKKWLMNIDENKLTFYLLNFGTDNWKYICDLLHPNPKDFQCKYFQNAIYNPNDIPKDSMVYQAKLVTKNNLIDLLNKYPYLCQCYSYLRKTLLNFSNEFNEHESRIETIIKLGFTRHEALCALESNYNNVEQSAQWLFEDNNKNSCVNRNINDPNDGNLIPNEAKHTLSENAPLEDILWWYDELHSIEVELEVSNRLKNALKNNNKIFNPHSPRANYGKLMERILAFKEHKYKFIKELIPFAEKSLNNMKLSNNMLNIVIFGDASGSMEVAIKSSCIIASLLSVSLNADLKFFNSKCFSPKKIPRTVEETIDIAESTQAYGGTCMASAIYDYYINKIKVDLFILVSDEGENEKKDNLWFSDFFKKYRNEINKDCKLFLVSFLKTGDDGLINKRLKNKNINDHKQFRLHPINPDTSKFDSLLGRIILMLDTMKQKNYLLSDLFMKYYSNIFGSKISAMNIADIICSML